MQFFITQSLYWPFELESNKHQPPGQSSQVEFNGACQLSPNFVLFMWYSSLMNNIAANPILFLEKVHTARYYETFFTITNQINVQQILKNVHPASLFHPAQLFRRLEYTNT